MTRDFICRLLVRGFDSLTLTCLQTCLRHDMDLSEMFRRRFHFQVPVPVWLQVSKLIVLDPRERLSVRQALQHPWVLGKAARFSHMDTTQRKLQEFNARRKLKVMMASKCLR